MNRQIKFRGFSSKDDRFHYGFAFNPHLDVWYILHSDDDLPFKETERECLVAKSSIGQFTNLHDKNGNEIYEGDVLQTRSGIGYMVFDNCGYAIKSPGSEAVDYEFSAFYLECEIIGNIYENPELIS